MIAPKVKRTYELSAETVRWIKETALTGSLGRSQNDVVELAVHELRRSVREEERRRRWAAVASDAASSAALQSLDTAYATADSETWPE